MRKNLGAKKKVGQMFHSKVTTTALFPADAWDWLDDEVEPAYRNAELTGIINLSH